MPLRNGATFAGFTILSLLETGSIWPGTLGCRDATL